MSLVTESDVPAFIEIIRQTYAPYRCLDDAGLQEVIFSTKPGSGAGGESGFVLISEVLFRSLPNFEVFLVDGSTEFV